MALPNEKGGTPISDCKTVKAVVVTYQPDVGILRKLLVAVSPQVNGGIIVNNGHSLSLPLKWLESLGFSVVHLQSNQGVAAAQNAGMRWCIEQNADFGILFDQDSVPAPDMVACLLQAFRQLTLNGVVVGAVGPRQMDRRTGLPTAFIDSGSIFCQRRFAVENKVLETQHLISSGCLMSTDVWQSVGPFRDDFFVDYVDVEWCLRAVATGRRIFGVGNAVLGHSMGDSVKTMGSRSFPIHSAKRYYYMFRNGIYLHTITQIPLQWKIGNATHLMKKLVIILIAGRPLRTYLGAAFKGALAGFRKDMGP